MPTTGNPEGSVPQVLQFNNNFIPAQATTSINYNVNLPSSPTSGQIAPGDFANDPVAGAEILGTGATISPDATAAGTGTVSNLTNATLLVGGLGITSGDKITIGDGTTTTNYTVTGSSTVGDLINAINGGSAQATASLSNGNLKLTGDNDTAVVSITDNNATVGTDATLSGFRLQQQFVQSDQPGDPGPERHLERVGRWRLGAEYHHRHGRGRCRDACAVADRRPRPVGRDRHGEYPERQYLAGGHGSDRDARRDWHRRRVAVGIRHSDDDSCAG